MSQILPVAASSDLLATWAATLAQSQETSPETAIPTQVIFNVAAYPFGQTIPTETSRQSS